MKIQINRLTLPADRRILVTSDIHGQLGHLKGALETANFSKDDILFIIGDMIEKGPNSLGVLRYVMELCETHTVYPLIGNVDAHRLEMIGRWHIAEIYPYLKHMQRHWGGCLLSEMCEELGIRIRSPLDLLAARTKIQAGFQKELDFLKFLPTIIETPHFIFVHGGLPTQELSTLEGTDAHPCLKNDAFLEKGLRFSKYVVVGHWPVTLYNDKIDCANPIINREQHIISIDGGCSLKRTGQLNLLIIPAEDSEEFTFASFDGFPVRVALDPQEGSEDPFCLLYTDNAVRLLKREAEFSFVEHRHTGRRLWVLNEDLYGSGKAMHCDDSTDYRIPVRPGDRLWVILETSKGALVKKDGVSGWYCGRLEEASEPALL